MVGGVHNFSRNEDGTFLFSSEIHKKGDTKWSLLTSSLPFPLRGLRGVTVDNTVYITGGMMISNYVTSTLSPSKQAKREYFEFYQCLKLARSTQTQFLIIEFTAQCTLQVG